MIATACRTSLRSARKELTNIHETMLPPNHTYNNLIWVFLPVPYLVVVIVIHQSFYHWQIIGPFSACNSWGLHGNRSKHVYRYTCICRERRFQHRWPHANADERTWNLCRTQGPFVLIGVWLGGHRCWNLRSRHYTYTDRHVIVFLQTQEFTG